MENPKQTILITGGAGFIGSNLVDHLLANSKYRVIALDNFDPYYPKAIKVDNLAHATRSPDFELIEADITKKEDLEKITVPIDAIVHLAAKAGVRPSIENPTAYFTTNVNGTANLLELARTRRIRKFIFASSSSVYGEHPAKPWSEDIEGLNPISHYAVSKLAAEKLGYVNSILHGTKFIVLRLFSVYGKRQRPDLAIAKFTRLLRNREKIEIYGDGLSARDYTYVEDVVEYLTRAINYNESSFEIFNLGSGRPCTIIELIRNLSDGLGVEADISFSPAQQGDVSSTWASISKINLKLGAIKQTPLDAGILRYLSASNEAKSRSGAGF